MVYSVLYTQYSMTPTRIIMMKFAAHILAKEPDRYLRRARFLTEIIIKNLWNSITYYKAYDDAH